MKLILTADVDHLGTVGETVEVKDGYGRNFLLPRGLAIVASRGAQKQADDIRRARDTKQVRDLELRDPARGLDGMRRSAYSGLLVYGRSSASFVSGEFKADFRQTSQFLPNPALGNTLVDFRVMTILQAELGVGWQNNCGNIRITAGYMFAGWFNALTTGSYIPGVQNRQFNNLNETITFDGLVSRFEYRF